MDLSVDSLDKEKNLNILTCLLIASVPVFSKIATQLASAIHPSDATWCLDEIAMPFMTCTYSVLFILSVILSFLFSIPSYVAYGTMLGLVFATALMALFGDSSTDNPKEYQKRKK